MEYDPGLHMQYDENGNPMAQLQIAGLQSDAAGEMTVSWEDPGDGRKLKVNGEAGGSVTVPVKELLVLGSKTLEIQTYYKDGDELWDPWKKRRWETGDEVVVTLSNETASYVDRVRLRATGTTFVAHPNQKYGFDGYMHKWVPWKSVEAAKTDKVKAVTSPGDAADDMAYSSSDDSIASVSPEQGSQSPETLTVAGKENTGECYVNATLGGTGTGDRCGVAVYNKVKKSVAVRVVYESGHDKQEVPEGTGNLDADTVVVSAGGDGIVQTRPHSDDDQPEEDGPIYAGEDGVADTVVWMPPDIKQHISADELKKYLNETIYNQAVVEWDVTYLNSMSVDYDKNNNAYLDYYDEADLGDEVKEIMEKCDDDRFNHVVFMVVPMYNRGKKTDPNIPTMPAGLAVEYEKIGRYNVFVCPAALHAMEQTVAHELGHAGFELVDLYLQGTRPSGKRRTKAIS